MSKLFRATAIVVFVLALSSSNFALADGPGYKVCNKSQKTYAISYLYRDGLGVLRDSWTWTGYFLLKPRSCGFHLPTHNAAHIFINVHEFNPPNRLGKVVRLRSSNFSSSNRSSEIGEREYCTYATGRTVTKPRAGHQYCAGKSAKRYYSIYWTGLGLTHRQVNRRPHTLTIH